MRKEKVIAAQSILAQHGVRLPNEVVVELLKAADAQPETIFEKGDFVAIMGAATAPLRDLVLAGPAPAPLLRAETFYRYQLMLRTKQMPRVSKVLATLLERVELPDDVSLTVDIDPVSLM